MHRLITTVLATASAVALATASASAATPDRCRARSGEQQLARSAQAVVLARVEPQGQRYPLQTLIGCSRASGKRRTLELLQRRTAGDVVKLIGVKLAGTRVAYAMNRGSNAPEIIAEDAIHGGRRHDLGGEPGEEHIVTAIDFSDRTVLRAWAVDAQGDVAWIIDRPTGDSGSLTPVLGVWRAGLGRRLVDSRATTLTGLSLRDGVLRWQRNAQPRRADLGAVSSATRCGALKARQGTLEVDIARTIGTGNYTACLRATGRTATQYMENIDVLDVNGSYVLIGWAHVGYEGTYLLDLVNGTSTSGDADGVTHEAVVDDHGSLAWLKKDGLWVRDAAGTRKVADPDPHIGWGPLLRDGATVTVSSGPTVTLNP